MFSEQQLDFQKELDKAGPHHRADKSGENKLGIADKEHEFFDPAEENIRIEQEKRQADKIVREQLSKFSLKSSKGRQAEDNYGDQVFPGHRYNEKAAEKFFNNHRRPQQ